MRRSVGSRAGVVIAALVLALTLFTATQVGAQPRADVQALLDEGLNLFEQGQLDGAQQKFEKALLLDITSVEALEWVDKVGWEKLVQMTQAQNPKLEQIVSRLFELTALETRRREQDQAEIARKLGIYFSTKDIVERTQTIYRAVSDHGVYLMPGLVERLAVQEIQTRVKSIQAITKISDDAVAPLCRTLHHEDSQVVLGAIAALKKIGNPAAIPSLKWVEKSTSDQVVRGAAIDAASSIDAAMNGEAYDLLLKQAGMFFRDPSYMHRTYHDPVIWKLENGALAYTTVHGWIVNELRAQQLIADAVSLQPEATDAHIWNACNRFAQYAEYRGVMDVLEQRDDVDEARKTQLLSESLEMERVRTQIPYSLPAGVLYGALGLALDEDRPEVAIEVIRAIREGITEGERADTIAAELDRAQSYAHRGVRFAASECIAYMNPTSSFAGADKVVANICEGLTEAGSRVALTILPIEDDALLASSLLRVAHFHAFNAKDGFSGIERARSFPPEDLIVIGTDLPDIPTAEVIQKLRGDYRTQGIPIFVLSQDDALSVNESTYLNEDANVFVINRSIAADRLRDELLAPLFADDTSERGRSKDIASRASQSIRFLATHGTVFDLSVAEGALVTVLENRHDEVRIPACRALGSLKVERAVGALVGICNDESVKAELHEAALIAIGDIKKQSGTVEAPIHEVLSKGLQSEDVKIMRAAAKSAGQIKSAM